jgi:hypothetical protein
MAHTITPILGVNFAERSTTNVRGIEPGTRIDANDGRTWVFGVASGAVPVGDVLLDNTTFAITAGAGSFEAEVAFADGEYGWVRRKTIA